MGKEKTFWIEVNESTVKILKSVESLFRKKVILNIKNYPSEEVAGAVYLHTCPITLKNLREIKKLLKKKHGLIVEIFPMEKSDNIWLPLFGLRLFFSREYMLEPKEWESLVKILAKSDEVIIETYIDFNEMLDHFPEFFTEEASDRFYSSEKIPISIEDCSLDERMEIFKIKVRLQEMKAYTSNKWYNLGEVLNLFK